MYRVQSMVQSSSSYMSSKIWCVFLLVTWCWLPHQNSGPSQRCRLSTQWCLWRQEGSAPHAEGRLCASSSAFSSSWQPLCWKQRVLEDPQGPVGHHPGSDFAGDHPRSKTSEHPWGWVRWPDELEQSPTKERLCQYFFKYFKLLVSEKYFTYWGVFTPKSTLTFLSSVSCTKKASPLSPSFMWRSTGSPLISMSI